MNKLRILHLTDFHYSRDRQSVAIQNRLVDTLSTSLKGESGKIDFIFFTGDLVDKGTNKEDFYVAEELLIERLRSELDVNKKDVFICAGNHDVNRGQEVGDIKEAIDKIETNEELNKYVLKQDGKSLKYSLENFNNYFDFQNKFYQQHIENEDIISDLYSIHKRNKSEHNINITTINSAWRALDSDAEGNLLYPTHFLKESFELIKQRKGFNIFLMHHPLYDFKYWNNVALENIIFKNYHVMFSGHTHKNRDTIHIVPEIGMYSCSSHATLSQDGESKIGYSIVEIDLEDYKLKIYNSIYDIDENQFYNAPPKIAKIPVSETKEKENQFRKTVRKKFEIELEKANDLFLSHSDNKRDNDFIKLFTAPIIRDTAKSLHDKTKKLKSIFLSDLMSSRDNHILFGKDKSGKTAILYNLLLTTLSEFSIINTLPLYIDCNDYLKSEKRLDIEELLSKFYELNRKDASHLSKKYHIKILLDNFSENETKIIQPLSYYLSENENASIVTTAEETLFNSFANQSINEIKFFNNFIWDIGRTQIRNLTNKWPNLTNENKEVLLEKIHKVFNQLNIPSNYWTVSLFIWIFEKNSDANLRSNFQLIELYIDNILEKESFIANESIYKIDYQDFKSYLSELAYYLITNKESTNYVLNHVELINFTNDYKSKNRKFVIQVSEATELILSLGVLKKVREDEYTFRLNGVFEYFLAYYMNENKTFRNKVIDNEHFYLSFANEFEICAGFNSRDKKFVKKIFKKTVKIFKPVNSKYQFEHIDSHLKMEIQDKLKVNLNLPEVLEKTVKPIPLESQDVIYEEVLGDNNKIAEVKKKKYYPEIKSDSENLEKALLILARVFRNSKFKDIEFEDKIFDFILNSTCTMGFQLMDEIEENKLDFIDDKTTEDELMKLLIQFVPIVIQTFFYDAVVQNNLERIIKDKIELLKKDAKNNQLKLLVLYFSLIDLSLKDNHKYIKEIIDILSLGVLKQTSLIKLYIYLATKVNSNNYLESQIKKHIKTQTLSIDSSKKLGDIEKTFSEIEKEKLINKGRE
jgi:predicted MPP superfamily phosphohydrolase